MNPDLRQLIDAVDRLCEIIGRAEARFGSMESATTQPDPLADHPELPLDTDQP